MLGVALSPWRSADLGVTIYRNASMVLRIIRIFDNRPPLREQLLILKDILAVVATVNFLNYGSRLLQNLSASVPVLGRFADDIAQGVGAGLLTSVAGHTAVDRCRSFRGWDRVEAGRTVRRELAGFLVDIRQIVTTDLVPTMRKPIEAQLPEDERKPEFFARIGDGVEKAMDDTAAAMDLFLRKPVVAAGRGVATGSVAIGQAAGRSGLWLTRGVVRSTVAVARTPLVAWRGLRRAGSAVTSPFRRRGMRAGTEQEDLGDPGPGFTEEK
jgi:hypothetical protein